MYHCSTIESLPQDRKDCKEDCEDGYDCDCENKFFVPVAISPEEGMDVFQPGHATDEGLITHGEVFFFISVFLEDEKGLVEIDQFVEFAGAISNFDDHFIGVFQKAPSAFDDIAIGGAQVFAIGIEKVDNCFLEVDLVSKLQPGLSAVFGVEFRFDQVFAPVADVGDDVIEIIFEPSHVRQGGIKGFLEFDEQVVFHVLVFA